MTSALKLTGLPAVRRALTQARARARAAMQAATGESLILLERRAQAILDAEIYHKARDPFAEPLTYELYRAFVHLVQQVGTGGVGSSLMGELVNTSAVGAFLEYGTDDEGTGRHFVPVASGGALHFIDPLTGAGAFSKGHFVHGVKPIHFMERALREHEGEVVAVFAKHLAQVFA